MTAAMATAAVITAVPSGGTSTAEIGRIKGRREMQGRQVKINRPYTGCIAG